MDMVLQEFFKWLFTDVVQAEEPEVYYLTRPPPGPEGAYNLIRKLPVEILRKIQNNVDRLNTGLESIPLLRGGPYMVRGKREREHGRRPSRPRPYRRFSPRRHRYPISTYLR